MRKRNIFMILFGFILMLIPFAINKYSVFRLISLLLGIIIISLSCIIAFKKNKIIWIMVIPVIFMIGTYFADILLTKYFNRIPVISFKSTSSSKVSTYSAIGYRVYNCNGSLYFDNNYKHAYMCENNDIETIPINKFLASPTDSFKKYSGKFVHIKGKIGTIIGNSTLYLNAYSDADTTLNGFVNFDDNLKAVVDNLDLSSTDYYIYDNVEVIGLVSYIINSDEEIEIHLTNAKIIKSKIYDSYELTINNLQNKEIIKKEDNIYYIGIEGIYYNYNKNNIYELTYLLKDKRETIDNLTKNIESKDLDKEGKLYELKDYNILVCENDNILFINSDIDSFDNLCEIEN